jgi:hypothetical protein
MKLSTWRDLVGSEPSFQEVELYETGDEEGERLARHVEDEPKRFPHELGLATTTTPLAMRRLNRHT